MVKRSRDTFTDSVSTQPVPDTFVDSSHPVKKSQKLRDLYIQQKNEFEALQAQKEQVIAAELAAEARPLWAAVRKKGGEYLRSGHFGHDTWVSTMNSIVGEFIPLLSDALAKSPSVIVPAIAKAGGKIAGSVAQTAAQATAGLVGGIAGGALGVFGVGEGAVAGAKRAARAVTMTKDNDLDWSVDFDAQGKLKCHVRLGGREIPENSIQYQAFCAEIDCWLTDTLKCTCEEPASGLWEDSVYKYNNKPISQVVNGKTILADLINHANPEKSLAGYFKATILDARQMPSPRPY